MSAVSRFARGASLVLVTTGVLLWSGHFPPAPIISSATAVIGEPLTALSYAGVARRTTRRAVAASDSRTASAAVATTVSVAAVASAPVVVGRSCVQVVNSYGQVDYRC
jgi:hypothetical protein